MQYCFEHCEAGVDVPLDHNCLSAPHSLLRAGVEAALGDDNRYIMHTTAMIKVGGRRAGWPCTCFSGRLTCWAASCLGCDGTPNHSLPLFMRSCCTVW